MTHIPWTDATWNPVTGCTKVSPGCAYCYIERTPPMRIAGRRFMEGKIPVTLHPDRLDIPLHWRKPRMVFVPSMGDLFHEDIEDWHISAIFSIMYNAPRHTFQVLTKRPQRMHDYLNAHRTWWGEYPQWEHVWLGVSVENQARADERIPLLLDTPAAVRFVSAEPLLGPLALKPWLPRTRTVFGRKVTYEGGLDWVIVGGESGGPPERRLVEPICECGNQVEVHPGPWHGLRNATYDRFVFHKPKTASWRPKPEALAWVRSLREQCHAAGVAFFWKQWGPRAGQGTLLDGMEHKEMPEVRA